MKKITFFLMAMTLVLGAYAQDETPYAYVTNQNVNLREKPSTSGKLFGKASQGDIYRIDGEKQGDWFQIEVSNGPDSWFPFISSQFVKVLNSTPMTEADLDKTYSFDDGNVYGLLSFEKDKTDQWGNTWYRYNILIKNRELQEMGGTGIIENKSESVLYLDNIMQPEDYVDYPVVYDKNQGLLWYAGFLWNEN